MNELKSRIEELEVDLRYRDDQIKELRGDNSRAYDLVAEMNEQVEDGNSLIDSWIEAFGMEQNDDGEWAFRPDQVRDAYNDLFEKHDKMVRQWNKFVGDYNRTVAPRGLGRPLEASDAQIREVRKLRKAKTSLRGIAKQTGLGLRTVRTIVDKDADTGRIKTSGHGDRHYRSGVCFYAKTKSQSADRATAYADAFAKVLRRNGLECNVASYLT